MIVLVEWVLALTLGAALLLGCPRPSLVNPQTPPSPAEVQNKKNKKNKKNMKNMKRPPMTDSIGTATMKEDGTIVLQLRAEAPDGTHGSSLFTYGPDDKDYASVLKHLGGLKPGESKPVPPWDD